MLEKQEILTEGQAKDLILKFSIESNKETISSYDIKKEILKNLSEDEIELLFKKIGDNYHPVAKVIITDFACLIESTGVTKKFIEQGGFTEIERKEIAKRKREEEKERIELEKSLIDLRLKKWQLKTFWWIFGIAIIGACLSVYNFINNESPNNRLNSIEKSIDSLKKSSIKSKEFTSLDNDIDSIPKLKK